MVRAARLLRAGRLQRRPGHVPPARRGDDPLAREAAVELGIAMQLTNILRDVGCGPARRAHVPAGRRAGSHGYSPDRLTSSPRRVARSGPAALDDHFRDLMRAQIARARAHYARGMDGVARLPADCRLAILLAARLYRAILDEIEAADYDVFTRRAATSTRFKVAEAMRCAMLLRQPTRPARRVDARRPAAVAGRQTTERPMRCR